LRLEPIEEGHPQTVALLSGPLVLFAMTGGATAVTSQQLLAAIRIGPQKMAGGDRNRQHRPAAVHCDRGRALYHVFQGRLAP